MHTTQLLPLNLESVSQMTIEQLVDQVRQLLRAGQFEQAEAQVRPVVASGNGPTLVWRLLAQALRPQGKIAETRQLQEMLVEQLPGDLAGRFDLSETLLLLGEFERGWREYRYRYSLPNTKLIERKVQQPRWAGEPMPGRTLLIHDEQGYGDTFQFLRLALAAKARSHANVILEVNPESLSIVQRSLGGAVDQILTKGQLPPAFDRHCELMSLPNALGLKLTDLPGQVAYITPDAQRVQHWKRRLQGHKRPLVALCWAGRPTHTNDTNRSTSLAVFAALATANATFVSIQKGPAAAQALSPPEGMSLLALDPEIKDFEDTAAILTVVDLLISIDSSPVHLAGAMNRPTWVLLPLVPDWRWLLERRDSPWYPNHRLYRQTSRGDWNTVMQQVRADLEAFITAN